MVETKNIIEKLAQSMADMTVCAIELERKKAAAEKSADEWYRIYTDRDSKLKDVQAMLAAEIKGHEKTKMELEQALEAAAKLSDEVESLRAPQKA